jgi:hypothetical protein
MAEVAIALAGFSGILTVFQRRGSEPMRPDEIQRFLGMVENSLGGAST